VNDIPLVPDQTFTFNGVELTPPKIADGQLVICSVIVLKFQHGTCVDHPSPHFAFWQYRPLDEKKIVRFLRCVECGMGLSLDYDPQEQKRLKKPPPRYNLTWMAKHAPRCCAVNFTKLSTSSQISAARCPRCKKGTFFNHKSLRAHFHHCKGQTNQPAAAQPAPRTGAKKTKRKAQSPSDSEAAASSKRSKGGSAADANSEADG